MGFESFTERMKTVIGRAHREALQRGDPEVGPGHMLVALLVVRLGNAYRALKNEKLTVPRMRHAMVSVVGPGSGRTGDGRTRFSAAAMGTLERAEVIANDLDMDEIDTPHLLVALLDEKEGEAVRMLKVLGVPAQRVRTSTFRILQHQGSLSGASLDIDLRHLLSSPEGLDLEALLARTKAAHRAAYRAGDFERAARIAGAVSEVSFVAYSGFRENWVGFAKRRLAEVLPPASDELPDCWPPE